MRGATFWLQTRIPYFVLGCPIICLQMRFHPQTMAGSSRMERNSFPGVAELVAHHLGAIVHCLCQHLGRGPVNTEAVIEESRTRSWRKIPYDFESDITLSSSVSANKLPLFLNHIDSVIITKQFQPTQYFPWAASSSLLLRPCLPHASSAACSLHPPPPCTNATFRNRWRQRHVGEERSQI